MLRSARQDCCRARKSIRRYGLSLSKLQRACVDDLGSAVAGDEFSNPQRLVATRLERVDGVSGAFRSNDGNQSEPAVERAQYFAFGDARLSCQPAEHGRRRPATQIDLRVQPIGQG